MVLRGGGKRGSGCVGSMEGVVKKGKEKNELEIEEKMRSLSC